MRITLTNASSDSNTQHDVYVKVGNFMLTSYRMLAYSVMTLALALTLSACAPIYETVYDYTPPEDAAGKQCLNQCLQMYESCRASSESIAVQERAACQQSATLTYAACVATAKTDLDRSRCSTSSSCNRRADTSHCMGDYRLCYRNCGGSVTSRQKRVEFCD